MKLKGYIAMGTGLVTILGAIVAVMFWVSDNVVWASDYSAQQTQQTEVMIQIQIDITEERLERLQDKYQGATINSDAQRRIERYTKKIKRLEKQQEVIDERLLK